MSNGSEMLDRLAVDDFQSSALQSLRSTTWRGVSDRVMGGISRAHLFHDTVDGRRCLHLTGTVSLENNGGFIQAALDLEADHGVLDASSYTGVYLDVLGNSESYAVHLRTPDNIKPWQSYRAGFIASSQWRELHLPFAAFQPHRLEAALDTRHLRRLGLVAIGRAFEPNLAVASLGFYRSKPETGKVQRGVVAT